MKQQSLTILLVGLLLVSAVASVWVSVRWYFSVKKLQNLQGYYLQVNSTRRAVESLANEAVEYSKRDPGIDPILQEFDLKPKPGAAAAAAPATKPAAR